MYLLYLAGIIVLVLVVLVICLDTIGETMLEVAVFSLMAGIALGIFGLTIGFVLGIIGCVFFLYIDHIEKKKIFEYRCQKCTSNVSIPKLPKNQESVSVSKPTHTSPKKETYYGPNGNQYEYIGGGIVIDPAGHVINGVPNGTYIIETEQGELRKRQI